MNYRLIKAHRNADCSVSVWGKNEHGDKLLFHDETFRPYFLVKADEIVNSSEITSSEWGFQSIYGDQLRKVYVTNPSVVPQVRGQFSQTWESDIQFARRFLVDKKITNGFNDKLEPCTPPDVPISVASLDIEVFSGDSMPQPDQDAITCLCFGNEELGYFSAILDDIGVVTEDKNWRVFHFKREESILEFFIRQMEEINPDCILGWNLEFDLDYLKDRCKLYGFEKYFIGCLSGVNCFDLLPSYRKLYRRKSYRLKDIAMDEGLATELEEKVNYGEMWMKDKPALLERNLRHTRWVNQINDKNKIVDYFWSLKETAGMESLEDTIHNSVVLDTMLLRRTWAVLPSKGRHEHEVYEGALVMKPSSGVLSDIAVFDLSRFYPNIILSEMLDPVIFYYYRREHPVVNWEEYKKFAGEYISEGKPTLILALVKEMIEERERLQREGHLDKLATIKGVLLSVYGSLALGSNRIYVPEIPARVTEVAREVISSLNKDIEGLGYKVVYSDTDSSFAQIPKENLGEAEKQINLALSKHGDYSIKLEKYFPRIVFVGSKKRYCGITEDGELYFAGFEYKRSDASNYTKEIQEEVMRMILTDKVEDIVPYLRAKVDGVRKCRIEDIAITKTLNRELSQYPQPVNYILAARESKVEFNAGDAINIIYCKNYPFKVAVYKDLSDLTRKPQVDYDVVVEKQVKAKVDELLPLVGLSWNHVLGQGILL